MRFLRDADIVPHTLSIEQFEEIMMKMVPPSNNKEHEFYSKGQVVHLYEKEESLSKRIEGDPGIGFHEFQLLIARIAFELCGKEDLKDIRKDPDRISKFFGPILLFRQNEAVGVSPLPNVNGKMVNNLDKFTPQLMNPHVEE